MLEPDSAGENLGLARLGQEPWHLVPRVRLNYVQLHINLCDAFELATTWRLVGTMAWQRTVQSSAAVGTARVALRQRPMLVGLGSRLTFTADILPDAYAG
jgi:hypothetical protein